MQEPERECYIDTPAPRAYPVLWRETVDAFKPEYIVGQVKDKLAVISELEDLVREHPKAQFVPSWKSQISTLKQEIKNLKHEWESRNPGKKFPVKV